MTTVTPAIRAPPPLGEMVCPRVGAMQLASWFRGRRIVAGHFGDQPSDIHCSLATEFKEPSMKIEGSTLFVTGGASGLGAACARRFAAAGGNVLIADLQEALGDSLTRELGSRTRFIRTDVTDERSVNAALDAAQSAFGPITV